MMKSIGLGIILCFGLPVLVASAQADYFGQTPPGMVPEKFAPGVISTEEAFELNSVFSSNGDLFLFSRRVDGQFKMFESLKGDDGWSEPRMMSISRTYPAHADVDMSFGPDGRRLYFISTRPLSGYSLERYNIWTSLRTAHGWLTPEPLGGVINGAPHELYPMIVADGSLYFSTERPDSLGSRDSYRAQATATGFAAPVNLGPAINSTAREGDIYVAPDESFLIHVANGRDDDLGNGDLYISFKDADGQWGDDIHMGDVINSEQIDFCPQMTPDGRYFMFSRGGDIFWVDAAILETFRP